MNKNELAERTGYSVRQIDNFVAMDMPRAKVSGRWDYGEDALIWIVRHLQVQRQKGPTELHQKMEELKLKRAEAEFREYEKTIVAVDDVLADDRRDATAVRQAVERWIGQAGPQMGFKQPRQGNRVARKLGDRILEMMAAKAARYEHRNGKPRPRRTTKRTKARS